VLVRLAVLSPGDQFVTASGLTSGHVTEGEAEMGYVSVLLSGAPAPTVLRAGILVNQLQQETGQ
jgi:hypothetical protein